MGGGYGHSSYAYTFRNSSGSGNHFTIITIYVVGVNHPRMYVRAYACRHVGMYACTYVRMYVCTYVCIYVGVVFY